MTKEFEVTAKSGERLTFQDLGLRATFTQLAYLLGFHPVQTIRSHVMLNADRTVRAQVLAVRKGLNSWQMQCRGSEGFQRIYPDRMPLADILPRMDRIETAIGHSLGASGRLLFGTQESLADGTKVRSIASVARTIGLKLPSA